MTAPKPTAADIKAQYVSFFRVFPLTLTEPESPVPPKRAVLDIGDGRFGVQASPFVTTDSVLAEAVAAEFDRIDPLKENVA